MKKRMEVIMIILVLLACAFAGAWKLGYLEELMGEDSTEIQVAENQRLAYGVINTIIGNEMTYYEIDEDTYTSLTGTDEEKEADSASTDKNNQVESTEVGNSDMGGPGNGEMPDMSSGEAPDMSSGEAPDMSSGEAPDMSSGEAPDMSSTEMPSDTESTEEGVSGKQGGMGSITGTSVEVTIPVGINVHTTADNITTFSRLQSGDMIQILYETNAEGNEVIVEIWMS